jgi:hypothetical protein
MAASVNFPYSDRLSVPVDVIASSICGVRVAKNLEMSARGLSARVLGRDYALTARWRMILP